MATTGFLTATNRFRQAFRRAVDWSEKRARSRTDAAPSAVQMLWVGLEVGRRLANARERVGHEGGF